MTYLGDIKIHFKLLICITVPDLKRKPSIEEHVYSAHVHCIINGFLFLIRTACVTGSMRVCVLVCGIFANAPPHLPFLVERFDG